MKWNKIAMFGGSFNPAHIGHINLCRCIAEQYKLSKVVLVPTNISPHKTGDKLFSNKDRLSILKLLAKDELFYVSDIEYRLGGISYTYNTVKALHPDYLIIGSDMLEIFKSWYKYLELLDEVIVIVGARNPNEYDKLNVIREQFFEKKDRIEICEIDVIPMSSTEIRERISKKLPITKFVGTEVERYIYDNKR